ncbi:hypothetical protein CPC08DRAFT_757675 [Agrocybe pediades]|nr:hypothetical protein CPC08DRAFT_757675 [Agrocybe pediades]
MSSTTFSQPSSSFSPASPAPSSSYTHDDDDHEDNHEAGPARKRARPSPKDSSSSSPSLSEQRKEARAHRNRIAAQNSRDRRKAQFAYLERRVAELEEENRRLRAGIPVNPAPASVPSISLQAAPVPLPLRLSTAAEDQQRSEREKERERENEELKERIKTLERGWDAVVKALAAQGVAAGIINPAPTQPTVNAPAPAAPAVSATPAFTAFPSPAPSHSSLEFDLSSATPSSPASTSVPTQSTGGDHRGTFIGSLGVPAAGGLVNSLGTSASNASGIPFIASAPIHQGAPIESTGNEVNDNTMDALFREILTSPRTQHATVPVKGASGPSAAATQVGKDAVVGSGVAEEMKEGVIEQEKQAEENTGDALSMSILSADEQAVADWTREIEMQQMLDSMIMGINETNALEADGQNLGLDMGMGLVDMGTLNLDLGLDNLGMEMNFDAGVVDYAGAGWGVGGASVF